MRKLIIDNFGPIRHCEIETKDFMIFTGPQATGKSTIAKLIFFFNNIGNLMVEKVYSNDFYDNFFYYSEEGEVKQKVFSIDYLGMILPSNFEQIFGDMSQQNPNMKITAYYSKDEDTTIEVSKDDEKKYLQVKFSERVRSFILEQIQTLVQFDNQIQALDKELDKDNEIELETELDILDRKYALLSNRDVYLNNECRKFFSEGREVIYIPAGRSIMTLLSKQLEYFYSTMEDFQKESIDYCTRKYLERILKIRSTFEKVKSYVKNNKLSDGNEVFINLAEQMMEEILQGKYRYINGEERLQISDQDSVRINFASSGQQEALWILNILFIQLLLNRKSLFIIEEPESNLFPNAQKLMTEFIAFAQKGGENGILITTHSPYILGELNNLIYAKNIEGKVDSEKLEEIISSDRRIDFQNLAAFYMEDQIPKDCTDKEIHVIKNEVIDSASDFINEDFDRMSELLDEAEQREEL